MRFHLFSFAGFSVVFALLSGKEVGRGDRLLYEFNECIGFDFVTKTHRRYLGNFVTCLKSVPVTVMVTEENTCSPITTATLKQMPANGDL